MHCVVKLLFCDAKTPKNVCFEVLQRRKTIFCDVIHTEKRFF